MSEHNTQNTKQMAKEAALRIREAIEVLRQNELRGRPVIEVLELSHQLTDAMKHFFGSLDRSVVEEFREIAQLIRRLKAEISGLRPNDIHKKHIPNAGAELEAVVRDTEHATENIMSEAEAVLSLDPNCNANAYKVKVDNHMMRVIEACAFQDLTGQRVSKVVNTLSLIEKRVAGFAYALGVKDAEIEISEEERIRHERMLNGPAQDGPETSQDEIDKIIADFNSIGGDITKTDHDLANYTPDID